MRFKFEGLDFVVQRLSREEKDLTRHFAQDQFTQFVAVLVVHMHKFHTIPVRRAVPDNCSAMNFFAQAGTHFELHGLSNRKSL